MAFSGLLALIDDIATIADDVATLNAALADKDITAAAIGRALRSIGVDVSAFSVRRHQKGECSCG